MNLNDARPHVEVLQYVKAKQAELKELEETHRAAVEELMGEDEVGMLDGKVVITWRHIKQRRFNQSEHKAAAPNCHELYMKTADGRQFKVENG